MAAGGSGVDWKLHAIFTAAIPFVMARCKTTGGFGATPRLPASIEDTYHALNILHFARQYNAGGIDASVPGAVDSLRSYLAGCRRSLPAGARTIHQLFSCCRAVGLELDPDAVEASVIARMKAFVSLEEWYCGARILVEVLGKKTVLYGEERDLAVILDRDWRSVDQAWKHIYLSRKLRNTLPRPVAELIAWFRACQNGDGGFGFFPRTTSFIENCHVSLQTLAFLGGKPRAPHLAFDYLSACQNGDGGFGRSPRAASFLDATWHALAGFALLDCLMAGRYRARGIHPADLTTSVGEKCQDLLQHD